jgi:hypothetical protein
MWVRQPYLFDPSGWRFGTAEKEIFPLYKKLKMSLLNN